LRNKIRTSFGRSTKEFAAKIRNGNPDITTGDLNNWTESLIIAKQGTMYQMTESGYNLLGEETGITGQWRNSKNVDNFIETTSRLEAETSAKIYDNLNTRAELLTDKDGNPLSQAAKANLVSREANARMKKRAEQSARTHSMWAYNEGAQENYKDFGVDTIDWLATQDDLTCEYCMEMDAQDPIPIDSNFFPGGSELNIQNVGSLSFSFPIEHPPLHPNCRCTIIGVV
jgi:hypothetical protein